MQRYKQEKKKNKDTMIFMMIFTSNSTSENLTIQFSQPVLKVRK